MLHVHRAERADGLIEALRELLAEPAGDPFSPELVAVPTRGMERWLTQRLSSCLGARAGHTDGICANVLFPSPHRLVVDAVAVASGIDPDTDPWLPERAVWPLIEVVDEHLAEPWLARLRDHLDPGEEHRRERRFAAVRHIADLFDRYALHRPAMVRAWADGEDVDGGGAGLGEEAAWQAELWRRLRTRLGAPGPAERIDGACGRIEAVPQLLDLPPRLSAFGLTRLPAGHLAVLDAIAANRDVHLFLLHPSAALWERLRGHPPVTRRADDPSVAAPDNRVLASWGHDARELQLVLARAREHRDHHHAVDAPQGTLLARLQADVRGDRPAPGAPPAGAADVRPLLDPEDRSLQIHACHGRARQVEVLREAILHRLAADTTLEPRDVIVMCPDIETYAPLIQATFGAADVAAETVEDDGLGAPSPEPQAPDLRVRLADRSLRQTNPVLGVVAAVLDVATQRVTASQVLDLLDREPVRRRFRLDDDDLARIAEWIADSGIRWGLDAAHRAPYRLETLPAGTWRAGLDRLLLGVTMTEEDRRLVGGVLALDDVDSGAIDLAGRFAEFVERLHGAVSALASRQGVGAWAVALAAAADALTATAPREAWQRAELQRILDGVVSSAARDGAPGDVELAPAEVRALLAERLQGRATRANFRTGHLTICTLMPMRSVPHRVVCLLGLDDGVFPRRTPRDGDDLIVRDPHVGDRDARTEDRQLLLDALLAATESLVVTYTGNDERTNAPRPPAVPVGELLDAVDRAVRTADGTPARDRVLVRHPLQPFDPRNFVAGELGAPGPWGFDRVTLDGARALTGPRAQPAPFLVEPLASQAPGPLAVEDLVRFVERPVRAFLRQRLGVSVVRYSEETADALSVELDKLESWGVATRILAARLAGVDARTAILAEIARGKLPPGALGKPVIHEVVPIVDTLAAAAAAVTSAPGSSLDVRALMADRNLTGTVADVHGDCIRSVSFSRLSARNRLAGWVRLLALTASHPQRPFEAVTIARARTGNGIAVARIGPLGQDAQTRERIAREHLGTLLDLHARGLREPLPLYCNTSAAYAQASLAGEDAAAAAAEQWTSNFSFTREDAEADHQFVLGGVRAFAEILAEPPRADESGDGWDHGDPSRFGRYAQRLWSGLLTYERIETP